VTTTVVTCGECERTLDEDPSLTVKPPCPYCGSRRRSIQVHMTATAKAFAHLALVRVRESVERSWFWLAVLVALAVGGVLAKWFLPLWLALLVAVAVVVASFAVRPLASARVIERERLHPKD
jgi:hypothetical protein